MGSTVRRTTSFMDFISYIFGLSFRFKQLIYLGLKYEIETLIVSPYSILFLNDVYSLVINCL